MKNLLNYTDLAIIQPGVAILALLTTRVSPTASQLDLGETFIPSSSLAVGRRMYPVEFRGQSPTSPAADRAADRSSANHSASTGRAGERTIGSGTQRSRPAVQSSISVDRRRYTTLLLESPLESHRRESDRLRTVHSFDGLTPIPASTESIRLGYRRADEDRRTAE